MAVENNPMNTRVLIASSDTPVIVHYTRILEDRYEILHASGPTEMLGTISHMNPALLILDPLLFPQGTTEHIAAVIRKAANTLVIVVEDQDGRAIDQHALFRSGVHGFCRDNISPALLNRAVQLVLEGEYWIQRKLITRVISELGKENSADSTRQPSFEDPRISSLTPRELQVARMVHMGGNNKMIAKELDISERTVKAHLSAIFRKLEIENRLNLALFFNKMS